MKKSRVTNCVGPISKWDRCLLTIRIGIRTYELRVFDFFTGSEPELSDSELNELLDGAPEP